MKHVRKFPRPELLKFIYKYIPKNDGIALDIGCGEGRHILPIVNKGLNVIGVDINESSILLGSSKIKELKLNKRVKLKNMDIISFLKEYNEEYDLVIDVGASHFIAKELQESYIELLMSKMKKKSFIFTEVFSVNDKSNGTDGIVYFTEDDLVRQYHKYIEIIEIKTIEIKLIDHMHNMIVMIGRKK
ncbi:MAG: class I SAM-dependent methyltransferase [Clostridium sp.]|uniref:class I SAM-dependent methyltransferase n=1 Tax=Clostridium sp. TaxID=1506 RepID=UPI003EE7EE0D